ncbi:amidase [Acidisphaera sp. L21]|uniref:amidase n=1 Tax=Acidisphaera sp. L21 TaxID=1641851 RepID=UPI00131C50D8|nr:amidase [Acidisphaera sp. L21]
MSDALTPDRLTASQASAKLRDRSLTSETLVRACLDRIAERDPAVRAWVYVDAEAAMRQAREADKQPARSALHGIPVGIKDMIDTADMPTTHNSPIYTGNRPSLDASVVSILRSAGAVILGKTDTTEFAAAGRPAGTRNPFDVTRTSGGSSAGSAAAVGDCQVPLALGTQTGGSTIRPASFCGAFALKPTWGVVSREGIKIYSLTLDTLGLYARSVDDLDMLCDVYAIHDDAAPKPVTAKGARIALCRSPFWDSATEGTPEAMAHAAEAFRRAGAEVTELELPASFAPLGEMQRVVMHAEGRAAFLNLARGVPHLLHDDFHSRVENRDGYSRRNLLDAYDQAALCRIEFDRIAAGYDAVLTPSAPGIAPEGNTAGDAVFNRMWTLLHVPCVNLPGFIGPHGMPVGVTLTSPRFTDRQLLAVAKALAPTLV